MNSDFENEQMISEAQGSNPGISTTCESSKRPPFLASTAIWWQFLCSASGNTGSSHFCDSEFATLSPTAFSISCKNIYMHLIGLARRDQRRGSEVLKMQSQDSNLNLLYVIQHFFRKIDLLTLYVN